ncbi:hypothetical protein C5167_046586 [Papaver somniferum]|uniref:Uncharacterized protein n=1 Tax=Papaver somniferum TaxID=3469 RepID=A0A4Y7LGG7_PAPSO|nr:hypothetical protein C5167_046586 [Papaver somniferum]
MEEKLTGNFALESSLLMLPKIYLRVATTNSSREYADAEIAIRAVMKRYLAALIETKTPKFAFMFLTPDYLSKSYGQEHSLPIPKLETHVGVLWKYVYPMLELINYLPPWVSCYPPGHSTIKRLLEKTISRSSCMVEKYAFLIVYTRMILAQKKTVLAKMRENWLIQGDHTYQMFGIQLKVCLVRMDLPYKHLMLLLLLVWITTYLSCPTCSEMGVTTPPVENQAFRGSEMGNATR